MPNILSSTALRNEYNNVSSFCHLENEPVFITRNGQGDLAVMSMELYEEIVEKSGNTRKTDTDKPRKIRYNTDRI